MSTSPEGACFKPMPRRACSNLLISRASYIRTKMAVVRLRQRKAPKRGRKWPKMGFRAAARGSDKWPEKPTFCGFPTADQERKKNVPNRETGGRRGARPETFSTFEHTRVGNVARVEIRVPVGEARPDPMVLRCPYPDMLRGNPRCEAPGTTSAALPASRRSAARGDVEG